MAKENKKVVSKLSHIEIVHNDPKAAADFMRDVFGAVQVEKKWSGWLSKTFNIECIHMMFGGIVYQILKPSVILPSWDKLLKTEGPSIHNLSLQVNGAEKLREVLKARGAIEVEAWKGAIDFKAAGFSVEGPPRDAFFYDATSQCGLRFEFTESLPEWEPGEQE